MSEKYISENAKKEVLKKLNEAIDAVIERSNFFSFNCYQYDRWRLPSWTSWQWFGANRCS